MSEKRKSSDEHPAVAGFKAKAEEIRAVTLPAAQEALESAEHALQEKTPDSIVSGAALAGPYVITVQGSGPHHNMRQNDAERLLARFIRELRANGHVVAHAAFKNGDEQSMQDDPEALASAHEPKETSTP